MNQSNRTKWVKRFLSKRGLSPLCWNTATAKSGGIVLQMVGVKNGKDHYINVLL